MSMDEYHARQEANAAKNQGSQGSLELTRLYNGVREILAHVEKAMALLGEEIDAEAKAELRRAATKLAALR